MTQWALRMAAWDHTVKNERVQGKAACDIKFEQRKLTNTYRFMVKICICQLLRLTSWTGTVQSTLLYMHSLWLTERGWPHQLGHLHLEVLTVVMSSPGITSSDLAPQLCSPWHKGMSGSAQIRRERMVRPREVWVRAVWRHLKSTQSLPGPLQRFVEEQAFPSISFKSKWYTFFKKVYHSNFWHQSKVLRWFADVCCRANRAILRVALFQMNKFRPSENNTQPWTRNKQHSCQSVQATSWSMAGDKTVLCTKSCTGVIAKDV